MNNYQKKYLKYKNKYTILKNLLSNKNMTGGMVDFTNLDDGYIYRCAPNISEMRTYEGILSSVRKCDDTGKSGLYFANTAIISLAMCIEYNKLMDIGIFEIVKPLTNIIQGKYSHRALYPERYIRPDGSFITNVEILPDENISHVGCELSLLSSPDSYLLPNHIQEGLNCLGSCEIFLSTYNPEHLKNIRLVRAYRFNPNLIKNANDLHEYMIRRHFPFNITQYEDDDILIRFY